MTEIKPLDESRFEEFIPILEEAEEPLQAEEIERLREDFAQGRYAGFLLYEEGALAGVAVVADLYSVAYARRVLLLDELYVRTPFRGRGLGKMLFEHVAEHAKQAGYMRLEWRTMKDNTVAQSLYARYKTDTSWIYYILTL